MPETVLEGWAPALASAALFRSLPAAEREGVARAAHERRVRRKGVFFRQGDGPCELHLLLSGEVALRQASADGQEVIVRLIGPGEVFALASVLADPSYPVTAEALRPSHALVWPAAEVRSMFAAHPELALAALPVVLERIRELESRFRELATERVSRRLARALLRLVRHAGKRVEGGILIDLPLSREELARLTGTTLFTVSRCLSDWEAAGLVEVGRERVVVRRPHGLVALAEEL